MNKVKKITSAIALTGLIAGATFLGGCNTTEKVDKVEFDAKVEQIAKLNGTIAELNTKITDITTEANKLLSQQKTQLVEEGNKVKISVRFRGREMAHRDQGKERLQRIIEEVGELGLLDQHPKLEGRMMSMIIAPAKKKGA